MELTTIALAVPAAWIAYKAITAPATAAPAAAAGGAPAAAARPLHPTHAITGRLPTGAERKAEVQKQLAYVIAQNGVNAPSGKPWSAARKINQGGKIINVNLANAYHWNAWNAAKNRAARLVTTTQTDWKDMELYVATLASQ